MTMYMTKHIKHRWSQKQKYESKSWRQNCKMKIFKERFMFSGIERDISSFTEITIELKTFIYKL